MHLELAQLQHYVVTPDKDVGNINIELPPERAPDEVPWRRPLDLRLRAALRLGVLLSFVLAGLLLMIMRALNVSQEATISVRVEARALAASASFGLAQNDRRSVLALLEGLAEKKHIAGVALYDMKGKRFADYAVSNAALLQLPAPGSDHVFTSEFWSDHFPGALVVWEPAKTRFENVGWLVIEVDLSSRWEAFFSELSWMGAALLASLLFCTGIIGKIQQRIAEPMYRLARTSKVIVEDRDYTLRAWKDARDEMGSVTDCFNHLLDEIQRRGKTTVELREQLAQAREELAQAPAGATVANDELQRRHSQFLINMCHEIRTPMNRAATISKRLAESELSAAQQEFLSSIRGTCDWVITLTDDLLDFTRIEAGNLALQMAEFNPNEVVSAVVRMFQDRALAKQIRLYSEIPAALPAQTRGDAARIRQVISCLVANSIKYCHGGEVCVEVSAGVQTGERMVLHFAVRDTGFGIAEEARSRIFQALSGPDKAANAPTGSAGLGLVIAHHLVARMGGTLQLIGHTDAQRATEHTGVRFSIPLQVVQGPLAELANAPLVAAATNGVTKTKRALILDDLSANRRRLKNILQKLGFHPDSATTLDDMRERCEQNTFDMVFANSKCLKNGMQEIEFLAHEESSGNSRPTRFVVTYHRDRDSAKSFPNVSSLAYPFRRKEVEAVISTPSDKPATSPRRSENRVIEIAHSINLNALPDEIIEVYLDSLTELAEQLKVALQNSEPQLCLTTARTLGACSAKVGATQLASLCELIESSAREAKAFSGSSFVEGLERACQNTRSDLEKNQLSFTSGDRQVDSSRAESAAA